jgi:two-component sensor histidine kinase
VAISKLYRSEILSSIYFPAYPGDLANDLINTYAAGDRIALDLNVDPVSFDLDTSIRLGLIIDELVSNSLKHAFPCNKEGIITIGLRSQDNHAVLVVSDTGIGFPGDLNFRDTQSMGMQLVVILVDQLEGAIELAKCKGTEFRITFPVTE